MISNPNERSYMVIAHLRCHCKETSGVSSLMHGIQRNKRIFFLSIALLLQGDERGFIFYALEFEEMSGVLR